MKEQAAEKKPAGKAPAEGKTRGGAGPWRAVFWLLMFLPLAMTLAALVVLPDRVPMHYNLAGEVDRWGSKYENLVFPALVWAMGGFFLGMVRLARRQGGESNGPAAERMLWVCGSGTLFLFNVMTAYFLIEAGRLAAGAGGTIAQGTFTRLMFTIAGLLFPPLGNAMPKLRRNGWVGVRTSWSLASDENWRKSQRAGGVVMMAGGAVLAVGNVFFVRTTEQSLWFSLGCMVLLVVVLLIATAAVSRKSKKE